MSSFDLLHQLWVPVLDAGVDLRDAPGAPTTPRVLGLGEVVARAHEIQEIVGETPLETIALNRLLLALTLDIHGLGPDPSPWWTLWDAGRADAAALGRYVAQHAERFDLLHPERPFYQHPVPLARDETTLSQLRHAEAAGNNATLFGHQMDDPPRPEGEPAQTLSLAEAARSVVAYQAFGLGGLAGSAAAGGRLAAFKHASLVSGAVFWLRGRSLFEAFLLNAPPDDEVWIGGGEDAPAWRRGLPGKALRPPEGLLDLLTWQARHVTLVTTAGPDGTPAATGVYIANGETVEADGVPDPAMARVESKLKGVFAFGLRAERAVWRDLDVLHHASDPANPGAPQTFRAVAALAAENDAGRMPGRRRAPLAADVFGVENDKSKMLRWRHHRVPVFPPLLADPNRLATLREALRQDADEQAGTLRFAIRTTAEYLLFPPPAGSDDRPSADTKAVSALADSLGAERRFWQAVEPPFATFLGQLARADDYDGFQTALLEWDRAIEAAAAHAFDDATSSLDRSARHLRARAQGLRLVRAVDRLRAHREAEARADHRPAA